MFKIPLELRPHGGHTLFSLKDAEAIVRYCAKLCDMEQVSDHLTSNPVHYAYNKALRDAKQAIRRAFGLEE